MEEIKNYRYKFKFINKNPNFKFEKFIKTTNENLTDFSGLFDVFTYFKDNEQYIITPAASTFLIYLIRITDNQLIKSLKGHNECICCLNYFKNNKKINEEYILSSDINGLLIVWDISNDFKIKHKINTKEVIFSSIILFNVNNKENYIIASNIRIAENERTNYTKIYSLSTGKFVKNLINTNMKKAYYILPWYNKNNNILYEIECCYEKITIINIEKNEIYHEFVSEWETEAFTYGLIINKNNKDYLCSTSMHGEIKFWDLENKKLEVKIKTGGLNLKMMIKWSEKYIIFTDNIDGSINKSFKILDLDNMKIISNIGGKHKKSITCIKKINHFKYGNILITGEIGQSLIIWSQI